jgi:hypothetical protein
MIAKDQLSDTILTLPEPFSWIFLLFAPSTFCSAVILVQEYKPQSFYITGLGIPWI